MYRVTRTITITLTEYEAVEIRCILSGILHADANDLGELKKSGYSARTVRAIERVISKLRDSP